MATLEDLQKRCPHSTEAERRRFHKAFPRDSTKRLVDYLEWKRKHQLDDATSVNGKTTVEKADKNDAENWREAVSTAFSHVGDGVNGNTPLEKSETRRLKTRRKKRQLLPHARGNDTATCTDDRIPRILYMHPTDGGGTLCDKDGHRLIKVLPARIDQSAASAETYATIFALYLERHLCRHDEEELTVVMDMRPGKGWPNSPAFQMVGFIRNVTRQLHQFYPNRLHRCIIYPVPQIANVLWQTIKGFLDPNFASVIYLATGSAGLESPLPRNKMQEYIAEAELEVLERTRLNAFVIEDPLPKLLIEKTASLSLRDEVT